VATPELTSADRRALRAHGQTLPAAIQVGHNGVTATVLQELAGALARDGLVKVRLVEPDRKTRAEWVNQLASGTEAALVGTVGRTALLYRPVTEP